MDELDHAIQRWTERLFLAKELLPSDPPTSVQWEREVVSEIENTLRREPEALPRLRPALIRAREALSEGEVACESFQSDARGRNQAFHAHQAEHARNRIS
jgi:hypothetical protein